MNCLYREVAQNSGLLIYELDFKEKSDQSMVKEVALRNFVALSKKT